MKFDNQLRYGMEVLDQYAGEIPLQAWLKNYFRAHPQMGARDRRALSAMIFSYYRLGHALRRFSVEDRVLAGIFLCHQDPQDILAYFKPGWNEIVNISPSEKLALLDPSGKDSAIFPWMESLSGAIESSAFSLSHLRQSDLFLRVRPGHKQQVLKKMTQAGWPYEWIEPRAIRLPNATKVEDTLEMNREVVVQDFSSQSMADLMLQHMQTCQKGCKVWDCCAGSGGKSILLHDLFPDSYITVSDIRESILINLGKRFDTAGITRYKSVQADLSRKPVAIPGNPFDFVLADVPCSGSGTWGRNPERLFFYQPRETDGYEARQQSIVSAAIPMLRKNGSLLYMTCSVFRQENEAMAQYITEKLGLKLVTQQVIKGYETRADTMFAAFFLC